MAKAGIVEEDEACDGVAVPPDVAVPPLAIPDVAVAVVTSLGVLP